jgi:hypothetical protein
MAMSNLAAGWLADKAGAGAQNPAGYTVMLWFFFLLSLTALSSAALLWRREMGPRGPAAGRFLAPEPVDNESSPATDRS